MWCSFECVFVLLPYACRVCLCAISYVAKGMRQIQSNGNILVSRFKQCKGGCGGRGVGDKLLELTEEAAKKEKKF